MEFINNNNNNLVNHGKLISILKKESDICNNPDLYDGSYELVRKTVEFLSHLDLQDCNVSDMEMLYVMTLLTTTCGWDCKEKRIMASSLKKVDKDFLIKLLNKIKKNAANGMYINSNNGSIGMFGTGFMTFQGKLIREDAQKFLKLCVDIKDIYNINEIFEKVNLVLKEKIDWLGVASISQILHCLNPYVFPILNGAMGYNTKIYDELNINLEKPIEGSNYIQNTKIIKKIRDENFNFVKNYRAFDLLNFHISDIYNEKLGISLKKSENIEKLGLNRIYYGAPGTGKSYQVDNNKEFKGYDSYRITFHPEFTYFDFVGGLKPNVSKEDKKISYKFVPGSFTNILLKALKNPKNHYCLIIEEINRANTAAVFGDIFQLLDRKNGEIEYGIVNNELIEYLNDNLINNISEIKIPSNLSLIATMNSADQGVYVMDSAFKRRWEFKYVKISFDDHPFANQIIEGFNITWKDFVEILNDHLSNIAEVEEDKLIGPYFLKPEELTDKEKIASKLLIYLWDDVIRYQREKMFIETKRFSKVVDDFNNNKSIFLEDIHKKFNENKENASNGPENVNEIL